MSKLRSILSMPLPAPVLWAALVLPACGAPTGPIEADQSGGQEERVASGAGSGLGGIRPALPLNAGTDTQTTMPRGLTTWLVGGQPGLRVKVTLERVENSGGHFHGGRTGAAVAVGTISPTDFVLGPTYPQNVVLTHRAADVSGDIRVKASFSSGDVHVGYTQVRVPGLVPIRATAHLSLDPSSDTGHSMGWYQGYYALPEVVSKLYQLASGYAAEAHASITITDASLVTGGRYDLNWDWVAPHCQHLYGKNVDVRIRDMSGAQQAIFRRVAMGLGFNVVVHQPPHWHLTYRGARAAAPEIIPEDDGC